MNTASSTEKRTRPVIGIMAGNFHKEYCRRTINEIHRNLEYDDVDIRLYLGLDASHMVNSYSLADNGFDTHYLSLFGYSHFDCPDVLIVFYGTITSSSDPEVMADFMKKLPQVPVIILEDETIMQDAVNITVDHSIGMRQCVEHLIRVHHCEKIAFLSGPRDFHDASVRLKAFRDVMSENHLPVPETMVAYGDFSNQVDSLVEQLLQDNDQIDAIVAANDEMAESVYRVLRQHHLTVGKEIAVTGYDGIHSSRYLDPPLTTVLPDYKGMAAAAAENVRKLLHNQKPVSIRLQSHPVYHLSCGCQPSVDAPSKQGAAEDHQLLIECRDKIKELELQNLMNSLTLRNVLVESIRIDSFFTTLGEQLSQIGTRQSCIALLKTPQRIDDTNILHLFWPRIVCSRSPEA